MLVNQVILRVHALLEEPLTTEIVGVIGQIMLSLPMRYCFACETWKDNSKFACRKGTKEYENGYRYWCKHCVYVERRGEIFTTPVTKWGQFSLQRQKRQFARLRRREKEAKRLLKQQKACI